MDSVIEIEGLSKTYGQVLAVDLLDLHVKRGEIYGFIGLNGAGKTTTIRALLGMIRPSAGSLSVLGEAVGPNGRGPWKKVGHLVDRPTGYPELTVRENLEIARRLQGISDKRTTFKVIERIGLAAYAARKVSQLSTGNLQRLGLARALLHEPELLILDEPANGLDPAGVVEIRELLLHLANEYGVTVFMSSHILGEVDRLTRRIGIIHEGRLVEELEASEMEAFRSARLEVKTRNLEVAENTLVAAGYAVRVRKGKILLYEMHALNAPDEVATILTQAGTPPTMLVVVQEDLEDHFLRLTGGRG